MRALLFSFKTASTRFGLSVLAFLIGLHALLTYNKIGAIHAQIEQYAMKQSAQIQRALRERDLTSLQSALGLVLGRDAEWLAFYAPELSQISGNPLLVGRVELNNSFLLPKTFFLEFEGATLGRAEYHIDMRGLSLSLLQENWLLYIVFALFIISMLGYVQNGVALKLLQLEEDLNRISELPCDDNASLSDMFFQKEVKKLEHHGGQHNPGLIRVLKSLQKMVATERKLKLVEAKSSLARQVAHDIRSPLAALNIVFATLEIAEDRRRLARAAIARINDIANGLLPRSPSAEALGARETLLISCLLEEMISEKRTQYRDLLNVEIEFCPHSQPYGLFADVEPVALKRIISNLINNSVEALPDERGAVRLSLRHDGDSVILEVIDDGIGIPAEVLPFLGEKGRTFGKNKGESGSGLGLYHARTTVEGWGGRIEISSRLGAGTGVQLRLPRAQTPNWFVEKLTLVPGGRIVVVDDDDSIHRIWKGRFNTLLSAKHGIEILHFSDLQRLRGWTLAAGDLSRTLFLVDYEFTNEPRNGLDHIDELNIAPRSVLVTNRFEEARVQDRAQLVGVHLIPKIMAGLVPIEIQSVILPAPLLSSQSLPV